MRPKLAYVVKYYYPMPRISGILRFVYDLVNALASDFEIRVFTFRYSAQAPPREDHRGYEVIRLAPPFPLRAGRAARRFLPDAVIFGSGFWRPYFLFPYWELFRTGLGRFAGPVILTQYTNMTTRGDRLRGKLFPRPDRIVTTTAELRKAWEKYYPGRVRYIPPGVGPDWVSEQPVHPAPKTRRIRIGYFGHLQPHKGPDRILRIFQEINPPDAELLINGEGEMMSELKEQARGWENIIIQGYVPLIEPWLRTCDLIVLPYRSGISVLGYSRVALEALREGIGVLTTPNPAVAPLIRDGENGFVCRDDEELAEKLEKLIAHAELRDALSAGAARTGRQFSIDTVAEQYKTLILDTLGFARNPPADRRPGVL